MIRYIITIILIVLIIFFISKTGNPFGKEHFTDELPTYEGVTFVHLYDDKGKKINVALINKPFSSDADFKKYLINSTKFIYIGISSYMQFPALPTNPLDNYVVENFNNTNPYYLEMYMNICRGWLHCFKDPIKYIPIDKPHALISESDFVNYKNLIPDDTIKEYDFVYSCPKVNKDSGCNDWVSYNKGWEIAQKFIPILCEKLKLKGLLIGREGCELPEGSKEYLTTTGWLEYSEMIKTYKKCKFLFVPGIIDASPRIITEAMSLNLPCLINTNILGGWKYINDKTGALFDSNNIDDFENIVTKFLEGMNQYNPRQYIIDNYGPINSGKKLKEFLFENFKDELNIKDCEYITIRNPIINY